MFKMDSKIMSGPRYVGENRYSKFHPTKNGQLVDWCRKSGIEFVNPNNVSLSRFGYDIDKMPFVLEFIFEKMCELEKQLEFTTETVKKQQKSLDLLLEKMLDDSCDVVFGEIVESAPCVASYMFECPN